MIQIGVFHLRKRLLELIIKEFRAKDCPDFAHLEMIKKLNMKGFKDDKCEHFRQVEDLVLLSYRSLVSACIVEYLPKPRAESDDLTATERRNHAASQRFKERADEGPVCEWLHICCEKALSKLDRYFKLAHKSPVYYTAMVMDPSLKYAWFKQRWTTPSKSERIPDIKTAVRTLWGRAQDRSRKAGRIS
jgi:hypothetical protein